MKLKNIINKILKDYNKPTKLISPFPGTGKSYFFNNTDLDTLDSDSSKFNKKYFPKNYIDHIVDNLGKVDMIFISSHKEVRDALVKTSLEFTLIYPNINLKEEYLQRYKERGSDENFINLLNNKWDEWINELKEQEGCKKIELKKGQFINDVIKKI